MPPPIVVAVTFGIVCVFMIYFALCTLTELSLWACPLPNWQSTPTLTLCKHGESRDLLWPPSPRCCMKIKKGRRLGQNLLTVDTTKIATHLLLPAGIPRERQYSDPISSFSTDIVANTVNNTW